jgi:hypothetical protein
MLSIFKRLSNDEGYVVIAAVLILVVLSIIGISATKNSSLESQVTSNAQLYKMAFYSADSGWQIAAGFLDDQFPLITANVGTDSSGGVGVVLLSQSKYVQPDPYDIAANNRYLATARFEGAEIAPLWDMEMFRVYNYTITSTGEYVGYGEGDPRNAESEVKVSVGKIAQIGG